MKMKKFFMWMMAAVMLCGVSTVLTSCSDDDDDDPETFETEDFIGKWSYIGTNSADSEEETGTITFWENGSWTDSDDSEGFWQIKNNKLWIDGELAVTIVSVTDNQIVLEYTDEGVKYTMRMTRIS